MPSGFAPLTRPRKLRAAASRVHGGASSLLRLAQPGGVRLPTTSELADWAHRAAAVIGPEMVEVADDAREAFVTPLQPSATLRAAAAWR
ncbi:MAG: hypothetical protein U1E89_09260 [Burkholderiaceae bacterium]